MTMTTATAAAGTKAPQLPDGKELYLLLLLLLTVPSRSITPDLTRFGDLCAGELWRLGRECEERPPHLVQTGAWGTRRLDRVLTCEAWQRQKRVAAQEGLVAIAYEREQEEFSRLYQVRRERRGDVVVTLNFTLKSFYDIAVAAVDAVCYKLISYNCCLLMMVKTTD